MSAGLRRRPRSERSGAGWAEPGLTVVRRLLSAAVLAALPLSLASAARAQPMLYPQSLPPGTVYIRLANALAGPVQVRTRFAGTVTLGTQADRISPYYVAGNVGGKPVELAVTGSARATAHVQPQSGTFVTVVLHATGTDVSAAMITDKPEYNQLKARLAFYNADDGCAAGSLTSEGRTVFQSVPAEGVQVRSLNPVSATVLAECRQERAEPLDLGKLQEGGLYSVWMMRPGGRLISFMSHDIIAPPQG